MAGLMKGTAGHAVLALIFVASGAGLSSRAYGQGAHDYPIPSSAKEAYSPIREGFESPIEPRERLRGTGCSPDGCRPPRSRAWRGLV